MVSIRSQHFVLRVAKSQHLVGIKVPIMAFSLGGEQLVAGDQSRFENMMKLLLFLEAELQLKEEIIDLLLVCIVQF